VVVKRGNGIVGKCGIRALLVKAKRMIRVSDAKEEGVGNPQKKRPDTRIKIRPHN
jgi:hypothetical protein